jgi:hypothetical protein
MLPTKKMHGMSQPATFTANEYQQQFVVISQIEKNTNILS